jgi:hypothetical protein
MTKIPGLVFALVIAPQLFAAEVSVEICASAVVQFSNGYSALINDGFPEECISLTQSASLDENSTLVQSSDKQSIMFPVGGCTGNEDVKFTTTYDWRYAITSSVGDEEEEEVSVQAQISLEEMPYTEGSGSFSEAFESSFPANTCIDGFVEISAQASATAKRSVFGESLDNTFGINGLFVDQNIENYGFDFNYHEFGLTVFFYGLSPEGNPIWFISEPFNEPIEFFNTYEITMFEVVSEGFGAPEEQVEAGTLNFWFNDCDTGGAVLDGPGIGTYQSDLDRLAGYHGARCN